jgi:hypothetical protein
MTENIQLELCCVNDTFTRIIVIAAFILGYLFFRFYFFKDENSHNTKQKEINENNLEKYKTENEDFFYQNIKDDF